MPQKPPRAVNPRSDGVLGALLARYGLPAGPAAWRQLAPLLSDAAGRADAPWSWRYLAQVHAGQLPVSRRMALALAVVTQEARPTHISARAPLLTYRLLEPIAAFSPAIQQWSLEVLHRRLGDGSPDARRERRLAFVYLPELASPDDATAWEALSRIHRGLR